jgi:hypothetical protein
MKISTQKPPNYDLIKAAFPTIEWGDGIAVAYGDTVYAKYPLRPDVVVHEATHLNQQEVIGRDIWWDRYLKDATFRFKNEVEAYQAQVRFISDAVKDRNQRFQLVHHLALDLSGTMYGKICTYSDALKLISR